MIRHRLIFTFSPANMVQGPRGAVFRGMGKALKAAFRYRDRMTDEHRQALARYGVALVDADDAPSKLSDLQFALRDAEREILATPLPDLPPGVEEPRSLLGWVRLTLARLDHRPLTVEEDRTPRVPRHAPGTVPENWTLPAAPLGLTVRPAGLSDLEVQLLGALKGLDGTMRNERWGGPRVIEALRASGEAIQAAEVAAGKRMTQARASAMGARADA